MHRDEFARNLAAGTYDLIVLDMLRDGPNYGYGIVKRVFKQSGGTIRWHEGTLYPVLHRLERRGLLASEWKGPPSLRKRSELRRGEGPKRGRQRRYYRLTARGQRIWREQRDQWRTFSRGVNSLLGL
jgi:DNA-binding PadR family transcriptional regulator